MTASSFKPGRIQARRLDERDELARWRDSIRCDEEVIYLLGNSLGCLPRPTIARLREVVEHEWGRRMIRGWGEGWYQAPRRIGDKLAGLLGADSGQVVVCDSTSVNLFKLAVAALRFRPSRTRIVSDSLNFPTDLYALQGCIQMLGGRHRLHLVESTGGIVIDQKALETAIDERTALVALSHVAYKSGFLHDILAVTAHAHARGALVLWDLSHSVGVMELDLDRWEVDLAVGCTYKYLGGGPGAPAFLYVRRALQRELLSPIQGWFSHAAPFRLDPDYRPATGIERFLAGTPPVLSLLAIEPALDLMREVGPRRLRRKTEQLTSYLVYLFDTRLVGRGFELGSPRQVERRGAQICLRHPDAYRISRALIEEMAVLVDFREPDTIRLGMAPLTTRFVDLWDATERLVRVIDEGRQERFRHDRTTVT